MEIALDYDAPKPIEERKMVNSVNMVSAKVARDLGFKSEGKLVAILDSGADYLNRDFKLTDVSKAKYPTHEAMESAIKTLNLPTKTRVILDNGKIQLLDVKWTKTMYIRFGAAGAYYLYEGTIILPTDASITNPLKLKALQTLIIEHKNAHRWTFSIN